MTKDSTFERYVEEAERELFECGRAFCDPALVDGARARMAELEGDGATREDAAKEAALSVTDDVDAAEEIERRLLGEAE